jgi:radical SAM superfamily enzyme YgiQ (UPF0313 family)
MRKRVLFLNPRYGGIDGLIILPLDQASAVSYAVSMGLDVEVVDLAFDETDDELARNLEAHFYDLCVITCITIGYKNALEAAALVKRVCPDLPVAMMGEHVSFRKEETLKRHKVVDFVIAFESEQVVTDLVHALDNPHLIKSISGLSYRDGRDIVVNPDRKPIRTLDVFPIPAKHLYNLDAYLARDSETTMVTTRGCTHFCSFCHRVRYGRMLRKWSVDRVLAEVRCNLSLGFKSIFFQDDVFCFDKARTREMCERFIAEGLKFSWNCNVRIDDFKPGVEEDENLIPLMRQAGCYRIFAGVESFSQEVLDQNKKRSQIKVVRDFVDMFHRSSIEVHASYVIGFSGDTKELALQTVDMAIELGTEMASFNRIYPHPGTPLGDSPESVGIVVPDPLWYEKEDWKYAAVAGNSSLSPAEVYELQQEALARYTSALFGEAVVSSSGASTMMEPSAA